MAVLFRPYCSVAVRDDWVGGGNGSDVVDFKCVGGKKYAQCVYSAKFVNAAVIDADIAVCCGTGCVGRTDNSIFV